MAIDVRVWHVFEKKNWVWQTVVWSLALFNFRGMAIDVQVQSVGEKKKPGVTDHGMVTGVI